MTESITMQVMQQQRLAFIFVLFTQNDNFTFNTFCAFVRFLCVVEFNYSTGICILISTFYFTLIYHILHWETSNYITCFLWTFYWIDFGYVLDISAVCVRRNKRFGETLFNIQAIVTFPFLNTSLSEMTVLVSVYKHKDSNVWNFVVVVFLVNCGAIPWFDNLVYPQQWTYSFVFYLKEFWWINIISINTRFIYFSVYNNFGAWFRIWNAINTSSLDLLFQ